MKRLEVHEHAFTSGRWDKISHSHEGGDAPHEHPDTGPASYTIDKDEWARKTGLRGGGRKKYTAKASGEQFPLVPRGPQFFDVFVLDSALVAGNDGKLRPIRPSDEILGGGPVAERMQQACGLTARVHDLRTRRPVSLPEEPAVSPEPQMKGKP